MLTITYTKLYKAYVYILSGFTDKVQEVEFVIDDSPC